MEFYRSQMAEPKGPRVSSGKDSRQTYETPKDFLDAVVRDWCHGEAFSWDLAASAENSKAPQFISSGQNSLLYNWRSLNGLLWLNCPFNFITPWAKKGAEESAYGARIAMLVPASVDANWWAQYVHKKAAVRFVSPRISFDGVAPYPKAISLLLYGDWMIPNFEWYEPWRWKK